MRTKVTALKFGRLGPIVLQKSAGGNCRIGERRFLSSRADFCNTIGQKLPFLFATLGFACVWR
jgi:hypothetical protein